MVRRVAMWAGCAIVATLVLGAVSAPAEAVNPSASARSASARTTASVQLAGSVQRAAAVTPPSYLPVLHPGARGKAVIYVQRVLRIPVTGNYGPRSVAAVKAFQSKHGIKADGVIHPGTWTALIAYAKAHPPVQADVPAASSGWATTSDVWAKFSPEVERFALCVAHHESWRAGLWKARSSDGRYTGAFQYDDQTWIVHSHRAGISGYARAYLAPPDAQALTFAVAISKYHSWSSWLGTNCGHGT